MRRALKNIYFFGGAAMQYNSTAPGQIRESLISSINSLFACKKTSFNSPDTAFSRTRKISLVQTVLFVMTAGSGTVNNELVDFYGENSLPTASAMIQRRNQLKPEAFRELFLHFTQKAQILKKFRGYQLIGADGSRVNLPYNPSDAFSHINCIQGRKGINQVHLNTFYDLLNDIFLDAELQGIREMDEKGAFCRLLGRQKDSGRKQIFIADRGYASYNIFGHAIHNKQLFLIRVPAAFAGSMYKGPKHWLEKETEDESITVHIGRRRTKKNAQLQNYHCVSRSRHYDFIEPGSDNTDALQLRVLKFPIGEDSYEYIVTNLPKYAFPLQTIKELYNLRWNHEVAYRYLKYAGNMVHIHSLKRDFLFQEIYAKLTLYNFSSFVASAVGDIKKKTEKYTYVLNHTQAQKNCILFLKGRIEDLTSMICRYLVPVRPGRKFKRTLRRQSADTLNYR